MSISDFKNVSVDITGLLKVLGENLYSRPEVAIRELIQNASDAIARRTLEGGDTFTPRIEVRVSEGKQTLTITDNGSGLTADEIDRFLARIGTGFTRSLRAETSDTGLIGAFGLGFLTAYMIGDRVEVRTTPAGNPDRACRFVSETGERYVVTAIESGEIGSKVTITLKDKFAYFTEAAKLFEVVEDYCRLMHVPIFVQDRAKPINIDPPWRLEAANEPEIRKSARRQAFAKALEPRFEPICTIPISDPENSREQGLLWIHDSGTYGGQDNRWMQVYVRGMMVARNKNGFLPAWAGFVSGVYGSDILSPTASREDVIENAEFRRAKAVTAKALNEGLTHIAKTRPEIWRQILRRHNDALLGAIIADETLFHAVVNDLHIPTSDGDLPVPEIAARSPTGLLIALDNVGGADELVAKALGTPVVLGYRYGAARVCKAYAAKHDLDVIELGTQGGNAKIFPSVPVDAPTRTLLERCFGSPEHSLVLSEFSPEYLSAVCFIDSDQRLKKHFERDDADKSMSAGILSLARHYTAKFEDAAPLHLVVNTASPLVKALSACSAETASAAAQTLMTFAKLSGARQSLGQGGFQRIMQDMNNGLLTLMQQRKEKANE